MSNSCKTFFKFKRLLDTFPNSLNIVEFLSIFSIVVVDFEPSFKFANSSFITSFAVVCNFGSCFTIVSKSFESASFSTLFKTLLLFANKIFNAVLSPINILILLKILF